MKDMPNNYLYTLFISIFNLKWLWSWLCSFISSFMSRFRDSSPKNTNKNNFHPQINSKVGSQFTVIVWKRTAALLYFWIPFLFYARKQIWFWNDMRMTKRWQVFHFCMTTELHIQYSRGDVNFPFQEESMCLCECELSLNSESNLKGAEQLSASDLEHTKKFNFWHNTVIILIRNATCTALEAEVKVKWKSLTLFTCINNVWLMLFCGT